MDYSSPSSTQAADKLFWSKDNPDSEQNLSEESPIASVRVGCPKLNQKPRVNKSVTKVVTTKVRKTAFKKAKARKVHQAIQAVSGGEVGGSHTDSSISS